MAFLKYAISALNLSIPTLGKQEAGTIPKRDEMTKSCKCVNCKEDAFCGKLWKGNQPYGEIYFDSDLFSSWAKSVVLRPIEPV
jgi:hypothetical protein